MRDTVFHSILLNLRKGCNALDRDRCLGILAVHGVGPRTLCILRTYWARIQMAVKAAGHYGTVFQSHHGVTQGDPCHPLSLMWSLTLSSDTG